MKKGFTLIEVISVVVVLSIITALVFVNVNHFRNNRVEKDYNNIKNIILESAKTLVTTDPKISMDVNDIFSGNNPKSSCKIPYNVLVNKGLVDRDTKNPKTNMLIDSNSFVLVSLNNDDNNINPYIYSYIDSNYDNYSSISECLSQNN